MDINVMIVVVIIIKEDQCFIYKINYYFEYYLLMPSLELMFLILIKQFETLNYSFTSFIMDLVF